MKEKISITLSKQVIKNVDSIVDRLFIRNRSQAIEVLLKNSLSENKPAVILLGGSYKRFKLEEGKEIPFVKIKGIPLIERAVKKLRKHNFREIYIIARKRTLEGIFSLLKTGSHYGVKIKYIEEDESIYKTVSEKSKKEHLPSTFLTGSAAILKLARKELSTSFLVIFGDLYFDNINLDDLWNFHITNEAISTLSLVTYKDPTKKGQVYLRGKKIIEFRQKPKKKDSYLVFSPIFVCEPEIFNYSGISLEDNIFPKLAKKQMLNGYVLPEREIHIHTQKDLNEINKK